MSPEQAREVEAWAWIAAILLLAVIVQNAWVCDDAFITARVARNIVEGEGAVFNPGWRVQVYTHPLWMLSMLPALALGLHPWWTLFAMGVLCSAGALWLLLRQHRLGSGWVLAVVALACSQSAIDYSTSGLENPLSHLIALGFAATVLRAPSPKQLRRATVWIAAAFCCRPDAPVMLFPAWLALALEHEGSLLHRSREVALGALPALAWLLFALVYHGSAVPNTAIAKLATGLPFDERALVGCRYLWRTATQDPIGLGLLVLGTGLGLRARETRWLALGIVLSVVYLLWIGGDFMQGRFLSAPIWLAAALVARTQFARRPLAIAAGLVSVLAIWLPRTPFKTTASSGLASGQRAEAHGIADERRYYARHSSLLAVSELGRDLPQHPWREAGEALAGSGASIEHFNTVGYYGYFAPRHTHVIDAFALCDPLLARLPPLRRIDWRPGHFARALPRGYRRWLQAVEGDPKDFVKDSTLGPLLEDLRLAHHAPLGAPGRAAAIWRLSTGHHAPERPRWSLHERKRVPLSKLSRGKRPVRFRDAGLLLESGGAATPLSLEFSPELRLRVRALDLQGEPLQVWGEPVPLSGTHAFELPAGTETLELWPVDLGGKRSATVCISPCTTAR